MKRQVVEAFLKEVWNYGGKVSVPVYGSRLCYDFYPASDRSCQLCGGVIDADKPGVRLMKYERTGPGEWDLVRVDVFHIDCILNCSPVSELRNYVWAIVHRGAKQCGIEDWLQDQQANV